jgi:hypothetical protein
MPMVPPRLLSASGLQPCAENWPDRLA